MPTYKILEGEGLEATIEKTGFTTTFTMKPVKEAIEKNKQTIRELDSMIKVEKAKMVNVENNHEIVKTIDPLEAVAVAVWQRAKDKVSELEAQQAEVQRFNDEFEPELKEIEEQTGITI